MHRRAKSRGDDGAGGEEDKPLLTDDGAIVGRPGGTRKALHKNDRSFEGLESL